MEGQRYWFLAQAKKDVFGRLPNAEIVLSEPLWPEAVKGEDEDATQLSPLLFTDEQAAAAVRRELMEAEPEVHLQLVEEHGEADVNDAWDNTSPLEIFELGRATLLDKLESCDFEHVILDGELRLRRSFIADLKQGEHG